MPCKRWAVALRPSRRMSGLVARWQTFGRQHHPGAVDLSADSGRRVPLRSRQAVAVDPQRDRRVGVAQAGAHDVDRDPGQQCQRRADVAQVVQPDGGQLRSPDGTLERQADSRGRNGSPTSVVNTWPLSDQAGPAASRSSVCCLICDFNRDQTSAHQLNALDNVRRAGREKKARQRARKRGDVPRDGSRGRHRTGQARTHLSKKRWN
jgi:hypothetical protein